MNILEVFRTAQNISKYFVVLLVLVNLFGVMVAIPTIPPNPGKIGGGSSGSTGSTGGVGNLETAMKTLCQQLVSVFGVAIILMLVLAAVIYTAGQIMGAETRARANVWATAMLTGALIGVLIYIIAPWLMSQLISGSSWDINKPCEFTVPGGSK
ncbi:MAG: hypothetical protein QXI17_03050 [Candidatus Bilamarchaeaceae archaeon]